MTNDPPLPVGSHKFAEEIHKLLPQLKNLTYLCIIFDWRNNSPVRVNVEYLVGEKTVRQMLELLSDGKWRDAEV